MDRELGKKIIAVILVVMFLVIVTPWTFSVFINRIEPWVGPFPWSIFIIYGLLFLACFLMAWYEKLENN